MNPLLDFEKFIEHHVKHGKEITKNHNHYSNISIMCNPTTKSINLFKLFKF